MEVDVEVEVEVDVEVVEEVDVDVCVVGDELFLPTMRTLKTNYKNGNSSLLTMGVITKPF